MKVKGLFDLLKLDYTETNDIYKCELSYAKGKALDLFLSQFADKKEERKEYSVVFYTLGNFEMALAFNPLDEGTNSYELTIKEKKGEE